jgi:uncharacterized protein (DUF433 family)
VSAPRIVRTRRTCDGYPRLSQTRMPVHSILGVLWGDVKTAELVQETYPHLSRAQIDVAIWYAFKTVRKQRVK